MNHTFRKSYQAETVFALGIGLLLVLLSSKAGDVEKYGRYLGYILLVIGAGVLVLRPSLEIEFDAPSHCLRVKRGSRLSPRIQTFSYATIKQIESYSNRDDSTTYVLYLVLKDDTQINLGLSYFRKERAAGIAEDFAQRIGCPFVQN